MDAERSFEETLKQGHATMPPGLFDSCLSLTEVPVGLFCPQPGLVMLALFSCWYEGDSNLVQELVAIGPDEQSLRDHAAKATPCTFQVFGEGEDVPDDGMFGDSRVRYKIKRLHQAGQLYLDIDPS